MKWNDTKIQITQNSAIVAELDIVNTLNCNFDVVFNVVDVLVELLHKLL